MPRITGSELPEKLLAKAKRIYNANEIQYEWSEVVRLIEGDPEIFMACLSRAKRYKLPLGTPKSYTLWICCNMASGYRSRADCYFCGKVMKREEFLAGKVHLEHFNPRKHGGEHIPANITLVCEACNLLKRDLCEADFDTLINDPNAFRTAHPKMSLKTYQKLLDFAEIISIRLKGNNWLVERFRVKQNFRQFCDQLRFDYRKKWSID